MSTKATFKIDYHQFLDEQGKLVAEELPAFAANPEDLIPIYALMVRVRTFDTKAVALQRTGKLGTYASCLGHEAAHIGVGSAMRKEDCFAPMYREYGAQFFRGVKMEDVLMYWGGDERGNDFAGPDHDFAWCVPIATQCLHAAGAAMAFKLRGEERVAVTVIGDGGTSKGDFYEAVNAAGAYKLPLILIVVNNQWAISVPREKQTGAETLAQKAIAGGISGMQVDGNDYIAMRWAMEKAMKRARTGGGGTVIEAITYRLSDHTTADDATRYRDKKEVEEAWERDPITRMRRYLVRKGVWDDQKEEALAKQAAEKVEKAVSNYLSTDPQPVASMFDHLFEDMPKELREQRDFAVAFEGEGKEADHG